jgi:hypothetical protein
MISHWRIVSLTPGRRASYAPVQANCGARDYRLLYGNEKAGRPGPTWHTTWSSTVETRLSDVGLWDPNKKR